MIRRVALLIMLSASVAGCGSGASEESAQDTPQAAAWDPCTGIPDELVRESGFDPVTKRDDVAENGCGWSSGDAALRVYVTANTSMRKLRDDASNHAFTDVTVADRAGVQYRTGAAEAVNNCIVAFDTADHGIVSLRLDQRADPPGDPACGQLDHTAAVLVDTLPT